MPPLIRNFLFDFENGGNCTPIWPARDVVTRFSSGAPPTICHPHQHCRNCPMFRPAYATPLLAPTRCRQIQLVIWLPVLYPVPTPSHTPRPQAGGGGGGCSKIPSVRQQPLLATARSSQGGRCPMLVMRESGSHERERWTRFKVCG